MRSYSNDLRRSIVAAYQSNEYSQREVAELFGVSEATVKNYLRRHRQTGSADALAHSGGRESSLQQPHREFIRETLEANNDLSLDELIKRLHRKHKKTVSLATMCRLLKALGLPRKKNTARK